MIVLLPRPGCTRLVNIRQRFAFADSLLDFTALSNALGVNTPSRTPNDPIRPPAVSLDHLHCFLPIAHAHQAIVGYSTLMVSED